MRDRGLKLVSVLLAALSVAACSLPPNPVIAHDPVPPPAPGYKVVCSSTPFIFYSFITHCAPGERPVLVKEQTIVRARG